MKKSITRFLNLNFILNHSYFQIFKKKYYIHQLTFYGKQINAD